MFKFGFSADSDENETSDVLKRENTEWFECEEIYIEDFKENSSLNVINCGDIEIKHLPPNKIEDFVPKDKRNPVLYASKNHSDLITGIYEGGLKIWECSYDLINFISKENFEFTGKKVLDLGCGAGLIGILCCLKGATCHFQDYNVEVIKSVTIQNYLLNCKRNEDCKFYSGDWQSFLNKVNLKFDFIFTAETIYNAENYGKLIAIFRKLLKNDGAIYLAAKLHYFGVGGGVSQFLDLLKKEECFQYESCWNCADGIKRTILKITLK